MKDIKKKRSKTAAGVAALLVLVLVAVMFFETVMSVKASPEMMPGIETIVNGKTLNILEIVSDYSQAEIGAYVKGQEPWTKLYQKEKADGTGYEKTGFTSLEDGLSKLETKEKRKAFADATAKKTNIEGKTVNQFQDFNSENIVKQDSTNPLDAPLSYKEYKEKYFLKDTDVISDWIKLQLVSAPGETRKVTLNGHYESAVNGDYTKEELTYYPVAKDDAAGKEKADYVENIYGFTIQDGGTGKPYDLTFETVNKGVVDAAIKNGLSQEYDYEKGNYGYYENIYTPIYASMPPSEIVYLAKDEVEGFIPYETKIKLDVKLKGLCTDNGVKFEEFPKDTDNTDNIDKYLLVGSKEAPLTLELVDKVAAISEQYLNAHPMGIENGWLDGYVQKSEDGTYQYLCFLRNEDRKIITELDGITPQFKSDYLLYIEGKQMVSKEVVSTSAYDGYYHKVTSVTFSCERTAIGDGTYEYQYKGHYAALYPIGESHYRQVERGKGNYYTSDAAYTLTPGKGNYNFVEKEGEPEVEVAIDHIYYQGGFTNNDWLKRFVLHLDPGDGTGKIKDTESEEAATAKAEFDGVNISVDTMTKDDLDAAALEFWKQDNPENAEAIPSDVEQEYLQKVIESYGLVYLNGAVSEVQALAIFAGSAQKAYPMIVNSDTILTDSDEILSFGPMEDSLQLALWLTSEVAGSVCSELITNNKFNEKDISKELSDTSKNEGDFSDDRHFVLQNVYFFSGQKMAGTSDKGDIVGFVNKYMNKIFAEELGKQGFKEITEYIETENKLRDIENSSKAPADQYEKLDTTLSQARAMEYVLNYRYKRTLEEKSSIKVLDLEPAKSEGSVNKDDVLKWMGYDAEKIQYLKYTTKEDAKWRCCSGVGSQYDPTAVITKINDGDANTFWHSNYSGQSATHQLAGEARHWFIVDLSKSQEMKGFTLQRRSNGGPHIKQYRVSISDKMDGEYKVINSGEIKNLTNGTTTMVTFDKQYKGRYVKFEVLSGDALELASCAEFKLFNSNVPTVTVTTMTTSEFVGKTGDLNSEYDLIYMGSDTTDSGQFMFKSSYKKKMSGDGRIEGKLYPTYTETAMNGLVYTHVGDVVTGSNQLAGIMDTDYLPVKVKSGTDFKKYLYSTSLYKLRTGIDPKTGKYAVISPQIITEAWLRNTTYVDEGQMLENYKFSIGNVGQYRKSGNDITEIVAKKLMDFVKSGYPVITENDLYLKTDEVKTVNEAVVDNSSYVYDFLALASGYSNVMIRKDAEKEAGSLNFYLNLPKVKIAFENGNAGKPPVYDESTPDKMIDSKDKTLRFSFKIKDEAIVSHETEKYNCKLFIDLNTDGNFAEGENIADIEVRDANNKLITPIDGKYALSINELYYVTRALPDEYREVISWKLQIESNKNSYIRCSESGVSKIKQSADPNMKVRVLQITPVPNESFLWEGDKVHLYLNSNEFEAVLNHKTVTESLGFGFSVTVLTTREYSDAYTGNKPIANLDNYDMIVMGFADGSTDIESEDAAMAIFDFINAGKSVLFAHDSVSFTNYSIKDTMPTTVKDNANNGDTPYFHFDWGVKFNKILRTVGGMDRYGIERANSKSSSILKKNTILSSTDEAWKTVLDETSDMAYVANSGKTQTYGETQGYSTSQIDSAGTSKKVTQVNKGAITEYPYKIPESFPVEATHRQYYQLSMEQDENNDGESDVVVWYCLAEGDQGYYSASPNDVRNNYYIYSKGNVMYTGVGHSDPNTTEMKLFVNTIVAAYHSSVRQPAVNFIERNDLNAAKQSYAYYSTDSIEAVDDNILNNEQTLYFKVSDKNLVDSSVVGNESRNLELKFYKEVPVGTSGAVSWKEISGKNSESTEKKYLRLDDSAIKGNWISDIEGWKVKSGNVYEVQIPNLQNLIRENGSTGNECNIYVTVSGKVNSYGKEVNLFASDTLTFRNQQLLDMD